MAPLSLYPEGKWTATANIVDKYPLSSSYSGQTEEKNYWEQKKSWD